MLDEFLHWFLQQGWQALDSLGESARSRIANAGLDRSLDAFLRLAERVRGARTKAKTGTDDRSTDPELDELTKILSENPGLRSDLARLILTLGVDSKASGEQSSQGNSARLGVEGNMVTAPGSGIVIGGNVENATLHIGTVNAGSAPERAASYDGNLALLQLYDGKSDLAVRTAKMALQLDPNQAQASYVLGVRPLQESIQALNKAVAARCDANLSAAAQAGLAPQCAMPQAALRFDYYRYHGLPVPSPSIKDLILRHGRAARDATAWPFGEIDRRLGVSESFRGVWEG